MPRLSTVIRPSAFLSSRSDETTLGADLIRRHNVLDAKVVPQWLQFLRNRWIILFRIRYAKNRTRALWWSTSEAGGSRPIAVFHPPGKARKSRPIYVSVLPLSTASRRQGHFFTVTLNA
jgi:hypothetical protein